MHYHITTPILNFKKLDINNMKMESNNSKETDIGNRTCYYSDDIIKIEDFEFDNILIAEKSHEKVLVYDISY